MDFLQNILPWLGFIIIALALLAGIKWLEAKAEDPASFPYIKQGELFTPAEKTFLSVLEQAVDGQYRIMGKVRLWDIISPRDEKF